MIDEVAAESIDSDHTLDKRSHQGPEDHIRLSVYGMSLPNTSNNSPTTFPQSPQRKSREFHIPLPGH